MRILYVAAFAVSGYASSEGRHCKPFNPLLGETYEADYPEKGIRFFSEKVGTPVTCNIIEYKPICGAIIHLNYPYISSKLLHSSSYLLISAPPKMLWTN